MSSFCALENSLDFYQSNMHKCKKGLSQKIILRQPLLLRIGKKMHHKIPEKRIVKPFYVTDPCNMLFGHAARVLSGNSEN